VVALRRGTAERRRGQLALIGVIVLASTLIALLSAYSLQPKITYERGHLQAAQLVHLARACMATGSCNDAKLKALVDILSWLNQTYPTRMYNISEKRVLNLLLNSSSTSVTVTNATVFRIKTLQTEFTNNPEEVRITVTTASEPTGRRYSKQLGDRVYTMVEVKVTYTHSYSSPFFNVTLCPSLRTTDGVADLKRLGKCDWLVGAPLELSKPVGANRYRYDVRDEFGIPVPVLFTVPPKG
jgi:hypothetical protein